MTEKNLAGESQSGHYCALPPLLAIPAVASVATYRKSPPIQRLLRTAPFCRRARNCSCAHKIGVSLLAQCPMRAYLWDSRREKARKTMVKPHLALVAPTTVYGTVDDAGPPKRRRNAEVRSREYLTDGEVNRLISAAGENRNGHRDAAMILVAYRHGLRAGELVTLRWDAVDFAHGRLHVSRLQTRRLRRVHSLRKRT